MPTPPLELALNLAALGRHVFPLAGANKRPLPKCPACRAPTADHATRSSNAPAYPQAAGATGCAPPPPTHTPSPAGRPNSRPRWSPSPPDPPDWCSSTSTPTTPTPRATPHASCCPASTSPPNRTPPHGWADLSRYRDGRDSLRLLAQLRGGPAPWPTHPTAQPVTADTPSGGRHLWYQAPAPGLRQAVHPHGLAWQVDIKAGWSYGLAPGTHTKRGEYRHTNGNLAHPAPPPPWLAREITRRATPTTPAPNPLAPFAHGDSTRTANYLRTVITNGAAQFATAKDGRKTALAALAYKTGGFLHWSGLPENEALHLLTTAGTQSGLDHRTAESTARRSLDNGKQRPITPTREHS